MGVLEFSRARAAACASLVAVLATACGGGGGGGDTAGGSAPAPAPAPAPASPAPAPAGISNLRWLPSNTLQVERDLFDSGLQVVVTASLAFNAPDLAYWFGYSFEPGFAEVSHSFRSADDGLDFRVAIRTPLGIAPGSYADTLAVRLCEDEACTRELAGSPYRLPMRLDVGYRARPEAGVDVLEPDASTLLAHDVRAAAYSAALDAVVMASALPTPALRIHRLATGAVSVIPLLTAPTSLALAPDGRSAAVGHDAAVSAVALEADAASAVRRIAVPGAINQVVLTASGRIVATAGPIDNWNRVFWIETSDGSAVQVGADIGQIFGTSALRLHPSGNRLYGANVGLSPDDVYRMELDQPAATAMFRDSRYHGEHPFCGLVQPSSDGSRLYTGCGVVLTSAADLAADMLYAGRMALSTPPSPGSASYRAVSLSVAPGDASIALIEQDRSACSPGSPLLGECHTRVATYDATTLARTRLRGLAPWVRGDDRLRQWARWVGHRSDGSLLLLVELRTRDEALPSWVLHRLR